MSYYLFTDLYKKMAEEIPAEEENYLKIKDFRNYLINKYGINYNMIKLFANKTLKYVLKPQRILEDNKDYYVAIDMFTNMTYICYKDIMMIDIDNTSTKDLLVQIIQICDSLKENYSFRIYKTTNGYHIFITNMRFPEKSEETFNLMMKFPLDYSYMIFCYVRSWCVRLTKKVDTEIDDLYTQVDYENLIKEDDEIVRLVNLHIDYSKN